jgi:hypothetical protein
VLSAPLAGCVSTTPVTEIVYEQKDLPDQGAIEIRYRNQSRTEMCLSPGQWPNPAGGIADAENRAFLIVGSQRFAMRAASCSDPSARHSSQAWTCCHV